MIWIINKNAVFFEEKTQVKDNWRTWVIWRLAKTDIDKEKYLKIIW